MRRRMRPESPPTLLRIAPAVLALLLLSPATGSDAGDEDARHGTVISSQQFRQALDMASDKQVRIDGLRVGPGADKAEVVVSQVAPLLFGSLCDKTGSMLVGSDGTVQDNSDFIYYGGVTQAAEFLVTGDAGVSVTVSASCTPANGFALTQFTSNLGALPVSDTLDGSGELTMLLGARIHVTSSQVSSGPDQPIDFTITAIYE